MISFFFLMFLTVPALLLLLFFLCFLPLGASPTVSAASSHCPCNESRDHPEIKGAKFWPD